MHGEVHFSPDTTFLLFFFFFLLKKGSVARGGFCAELILLNAPPLCFGSEVGAAMVGPDR